jgi:hypothetical protein
MPKNNMPMKDEYNPRWFIWTIVFLVVTGVSLVAFITLSGDEGYSDITLHRTSKVVTQKK